MDLLHIESLRPGPSGSPTAPNPAVRDEDKVAPYTLPDAFRMKSGKEINSPKQWWCLRRPELVEDFDREIYGRVPTHVPRIHWTVASVARETVGDIPAITKNLVGHVDNSAYPLITVEIQLSLTVPANAAGPVPVMMELSWSPEFLATLRKRFTDDQWAAFTGNTPSWQGQMLAKGWGYAMIIPTSFQADTGEGLTEGIIGLANKGQPRKLDDWGTLRAWAWGASRALDYFETDKSVDAHQVGIEGLSRYGKAALVAMAYDPRFAIGLIGSSGEGGAKIFRRTMGEQVENLAGTSEYHWMAGNFLKYAGPLTPNDIPVEAHELIGLCAPRPVFIGVGSDPGEMGWIDARGMFLAEVAAGPIYTLLGKKDLGVTEMPPKETALIDGDLAFRQHGGGHTVGPNWPTFIQFASRYLHAPGASSEASERAGPKEVALTFDDLPAHGPLIPGVTRVDIIDSIIHALQAAHSPPVYGFVNAQRVGENPTDEAVLNHWREAGFPLGNHTFSHMNLDTHTTEEFEADLIAGEPEIGKLMGDQDWHWLRFPYLNEGDIPEKHHAIETFLRDHGYNVAEVTLSFDDYAYNEPFARCTASHDSDGVAWLKQSYMDAAAESLIAGPDTARHLLQRDIKHLMLLHVGAFETVMLPHLLELLRQDGFKLIPLPQAAQDPAYSQDPDLTSHWDGTFLQQLERARQLPKLTDSSTRLAKLNSLCR